MGALRYSVIVLRLFTIHLCGRAQVFSDACGVPTLPDAAQLYLHLPRDDQDCVKQRRLSLHLPCSAQPASEKTCVSAKWLILNSCALYATSTCMLFGLCSVACACHALSRFLLTSLVTASSRLALSDLFYVPLSQLTLFNVSHISVVQTSVMFSRNLLPFSATGNSRRRGGVPLFPHRRAQ